jgi:hypothetical protein
MPKRLDPQQQKRRSLARAFTKFTRHAAGIFDRSDDMLFMQEESRLGIWIGSTLNRHAELFDLLAEDYFKGFEKHEYVSGDRAWVRFGYDYDGKVPRQVTEATKKSKEATA